MVVGGKASSSFSLPLSIRNCRWLVKAPFGGEEEIVFPGITPEQLNQDLPRVTPNGVQGPPG